LNPPLVCLSTSFSGSFFNWAPTYINVPLGCEFGSVTGSVGNWEVADSATAPPTKTDNRFEICAKNARTLRPALSIFSLPLLKFLDHNPATTDRQLISELRLIDSITLVTTLVFQ
jgi:hypothetical protein